MLLVFAAMGAAAQTENPRGIYKMITLTGKLGEVNSPFDQYKVCTDSMTLMVSVQENYFSITNNDHDVFYYTGEEQKTEGGHETRIYDSNAEHFTQKWWSTLQNHAYFPYNGWCIEKYESGKYSEVGKIMFDALTGKAEVDATNPLTGTWRIIGYVDELRDLKKELPKLLEQYPESKYVNSFLVLTPNTGTLLVNGLNGVVNKIEYNGKKAYKVDGTTNKVKWLSKDRIAVEEHIDYRIDYQVLERVTDGRTVLSHIGSQFVKRK